MLSSENEPESSGTPMEATAPAPPLSTPSKKPKKKNRPKIPRKKDGSVSNYEYILNALLIHSRSTKLRPKRLLVLVNGATLAN
jgi:hypothetical protein